MRNMSSHSCERTMYLQRGRHAVAVGGIDVGSDQSARRQEADAVAGGQRTFVFLDVMTVSSLQISFVVSE